jgi:Cu2+-exporting ATPase
MGAMTSCFHCGLPAAGAARYRATILGAERELCCEGCRAVAEAIVASGFENYYATRTEPAAPPPQVIAAEADSFVGQPGEASLVLEGVRCAACLWLIEGALRKVPGVAGADVNYATRRAHVRWDPARAALPAILAAVRAVGYGAAPYEPGLQAAAERREDRTALLRLFVAGFGAMQVMMYAFPEYTGDDLSAEAAALMRWAGLLLTTPVLLFSCAPFFRGAWSELRGGRLGLETPIALGLAGAFAASAWATVTGRGAVYFDSVSMLAFLLLAARYAEVAVRRSAGRALDPLLRFSAGQAIREGERLSVAPGERIPADGIVLEGASAVDESLLTGESRPLPRRAGDEVVAGSVNLDQPIAIRATRVGAQTRAAGIARLAERAAAQRPALVQAADRVARPLTFAVLAVALAALWFSGNAWTAVAVLVVTCPCALALAAPIVLTRASSALLGRGVLMTRSRVLQALARVTDVLVDKTGTLTEGRLAVSQVFVLGDRTARDCLALAGALEASSRHPIARAFPAGALEAVAPRYVAGQGIEASVDGRRLRMGTEVFCRELCGAWSGHAPSRARSVVYLADASGWLAAFELEDRVRPDAGRLVADLKARGLRVHLLSGDREGPVAALAGELGIERARGGLLPHDKLAYVRRLQAEGRVVAMIGDGLNDGPVLAAADASIALGSGADATQLQADVVLLRDALAGIDFLLQVSEKAMRLVRQNIGWALAYNAIALPAAALGLVGPLEAALGMGASSIAVLLNALRPLHDPRNPGWKASTSSSPSPSPSYS